MDLEDKELKELFSLADRIGKKRYHRLTEQDFENYREFDFWRYLNGDYECGTTLESQEWVREHSDRHCPICSDYFSKRGGKTIDHKLPRSQYPWLAMEFKNFWVICQRCNQNKGEMHWYEYERFMFLNFPDQYLIIRANRPQVLLE